MTSCNYLRLPAKGFVSIPNHTSIHWPCLGAFHQVVVLILKKTFNSYSGHRRIKWNLATMIGSLGRSWAYDFNETRKFLVIYFFWQDANEKERFFCSSLKIIFDLSKNMSKMNSYFSENWQPLNAICTTKNESFEHIWCEIKRERCASKITPW